MKLIDNFFKTLLALFGGILTFAVLTLISPITILAEYIAQVIKAWKGLETHYSEPPGSKTVIVIGLWRAIFFLLMVILLFPVIIWDDLKNNISGALEIYKGVKQSS